MHITKSSRRSAAFFTMAFALLLGACESGKPQSDEAMIEAGRANVEAMATEHANDSTEASPAALLEPARAVVSQTMAYTEYNDELVYGYFSAPADMFEPLPAVIMIHEWWGLNDQIKAVAAELAEMDQVAVFPAKGWFATRSFPADHEFHDCHRFEVRRCYR